MAAALSHELPVKSLLQVIGDADLKLMPRDSDEIEMDKIDRLSRVVFAHWLCMGALEAGLERFCSRKGLVSPETYAYTYQEPFMEQASDTVVELARAALSAQYGPLEWKIDKDEPTPLVSAKWQRDLQREPWGRELSQEETQDMKNGKLFFHVRRNEMGKAVKMLREGAQVNARGPLGRTPLYAVMDSPNQLDTLIKQGAKINVVDCDGISPLDVALNYDGRGEQMFVKGLRACGAKTGKQLFVQDRKKAPWWGS